MDEQKVEMTPEENEQARVKTMEQVGLWLDRRSRAKKKRDQAAAKGDWKKLLDAYKGEWQDLAGLDVSILPIQLVFAYVRTELPSLYIRDPHIKVNPKNRTSIQSAKVFEAAINYIWRCKKLKREVKKSVLDALIIGHSWFKTGYTGSFGTIEDNGQTIETVESEDFFGYRIPWDCITFDTDSNDPPYDCSWIAHDVWMSLEDVQNNPRYKKDVTARLEVGLSAEDMGVSTSDERYRGKVCVIEVWDKKNKKVFCVSPGCEDYLEDPKDWPYEMKGFPFSYLKFNTANDEAYGLSETHMAMPTFLERIKLRSMEMDHLKRFNRQVFAESDAFAGDADETNYTQGVTGAVIKLNPGKIGAIKLSDYGQLNPDVYGVEERLKDDEVRTLGVTASDQGAVQKTGTRTIRELMEMKSGTQGRRAEKIDLVEEFVEDIAGNLAALLKQFATEPYYIRILGANSPELQKAIQERASAQSETGVTNQSGFTFTSDDIKGDYDIETVSGSSTPLDRAEKMKTIISIFELIPTLGAIPGGPVIGTLARMFAEELDMPEMILALEEEQQLQQQMKEEQAQQAKEQQEMLVAQQAAETQIKAEAAAAKHNKNQIEFLRVENEMNQPEEESTDEFPS